jgi:hypothetical protein
MIPVFAGVTRQKLILFHLLPSVACLFPLSGHHPMVRSSLPRSNTTMPDRRIIRRHSDPRGAATVVAWRGQHITAAEKE